MHTLHDRAKCIRVAAFDVDGVLTDGTLWFSEAGEQLKAFNVRDGHGIRMLQASGVRAAIITTRISGSVEQRARGLGIDLVYQGAADKLAAFGELLTRLGLDAAAAAYLGDDIIDLPVLTRCGLAATVPEAPALVRRHAHYVTRAGGGRGAARELCELIMQAQGTLDAQVAQWLN